MIVHIIMHSEEAKKTVTLSEIPSPQLFTKLAEKHGHYCPMSTLGLRIGWAARRRLEDELLRASYMTQTCAVDGIRQVLDNEILQVEEQGRHLLEVADHTNSWQLELRPEALQQAASYRLLIGDDERSALLEKLRYASEAKLLNIIQIREIS